MTGKIRNTSARVDIESRTTTVIHLSIDPNDVPAAHEYVIVVNGVQVARWLDGGRPAIRAGMREGRLDTYLD